MTGRERLIRLIEVLEALPPSQLLPQRSRRSCCLPWLHASPRPSHLRKETHHMKRLAIFLIPLALTACDDPATVANRNLARAADNFEINRRITFMNGITNQSMLVIEGYCSLTIRQAVMSVVCRTGRDDFKRHHLGLGATVSYISEQIEPAPASTYRYRVTFNPTVLIPDIRMQTP